MNDFKVILGVGNGDQLSMAVGLRYWQPKVAIIELRVADAHRGRCAASNWEEEEEEAAKLGDVSKFPPYLFQIFTENRKVSKKEETVNS